MNLTIDNLELWLAAFAAIAAFGIWGYKKWLTIKEGGITLDEVLGAVEEAANKADEVKEVVEEAIEATE